MATELLDQIMAFEQGEMDEQELVDFFQDLINTGMAWELQGFYGRTARDLINAGHCTLPERRA